MPNIKIDLERVFRPHRNPKPIWRVRVEDYNESEWFAEVNGKRQLEKVLTGPWDVVFHALQYGGGAADAIIATRDSGGSARINGSAWSCYRFNLMVETGLNRVK